MDEYKFPLIAVIIDTLTPFIVTMIDFDNKHVRRTISQNGDGEWFSFEDVYLMENHECSIGLENYLLNSDINYCNYDKVGGESRVYNNRFNQDCDVYAKRIQEKNIEINRRKREVGSLKKDIENTKLGIRSLEGIINNEETELLKLKDLQKDEKKNKHKS